MIATLVICVPSIFAPVSSQASQENSSNVQVVQTEKPTRPTAAIEPAPKGHYDEMFREARNQKGRRVGIVRPEYQEIVDVASQMTSIDVRAAEASTQQDFRGDNVLSLVPRIILDTDYDEILKPGIDQRGRALRAFLQDFHRNNGKPEISNTGRLPQEVLDQIVARSTERWAVGAVNPDSISLMYGPDIIRDSSGVFRVVEDNTGFLGGFGDLKLALESLYKNVPYPEIHERNPMDFYITLLERYKQRANPSGGAVVMLMIPPYADNEDPRLRLILKSLGIEVVTPFSKAKLEFDSNKQAWLKPADGGRRKRVGFLILNGEHWWLDMHHEDLSRVAIFEYSKLVVDELSEIRKLIDAREASAPDSRSWRKAKREKRILDRKLEFLRRMRTQYGLDQMSNKAAAKLLRQFMRVIGDKDALTGLPDTEKLTAALGKLKQIDELREWQRRSYHGLVDSVLEGKVSSNYTPGTNFVNDKAFYPYVEDLVRFYLKEEPILKNIETYDPRVIRGGVPMEFDAELAKTVTKNQSEWVIKLVDGRGGKGIWVGPKVSAKEFKKGIEAVKAEPARYKYQRYTALSAISQYIVDVRVHSDLPPKGSLFVSDTAWGRGLSVLGDGKVNLSSQGRETTVIVRSAQKFCESMFVPTQLPSSMVYKRKSR